MELTFLFGIDQTFKITILKLFSSTKPQVRALF
nr:MAG TPA: hypothetical protein [Caudoviricetes sp.]